MEKAEGAVDFGTGANAPLHGAVALTSARLLDRAASPRFNLLLGRGAIALERRRMAGKNRRHRRKEFAAGRYDVHPHHGKRDGSAHIAAPHIAFATGKLQPETLSPLLAAFRHADGAADFSGDIDWTPREIKSQRPSCHRQSGFFHAAGKGPCGEDGV